jgi:hypothetical protein
MGKWTFDRWMTILGFAVAVGVNVQMLTQIKDDVAKLKEFNETTLSQRFVPREIYDLNQQHLTAAINDLRVTLEKLYALEQRTGEPARIQRMFDK